ncbi:hypothetical protein NPIL_158491 [Nephila pilipes]|uniref:Uncharacterized protein n=1 Tax=Nephila pilipes TaxID=299642 RepID=A0A8X6J6Y7_NEPPI|nr:hypothetical protein NPIL_158491 [Nephila pilipes]
MRTISNGIGDWWNFASCRVLCLLLRGRNCAGGISWKRGKGLVCLTGILVVKCLALEECADLTSDIVPRRGRYYLNLSKSSHGCVDQSFTGEFGHRGL